MTSPIFKPSASSYSTSGNKNGTGVFIKWSVVTPPVVKLATESVLNVTLVGESTPPDAVEPLTAIFFNSILLLYVSILLIKKTFFTPLTWLFKKEPPFASPIFVALVVYSTSWPNLNILATYNPPGESSYLTMPLVSMSAPVKPAEDEGLGNVTHPPVVADWILYSVLLFKSDGS